MDQIEEQVRISEHRIVSYLGKLLIISLFFLGCQRDKLPVLNNYLKIKKYTERNSSHFYVKTVEESNLMTIYEFDSITGLSYLSSYIIATGCLESFLICDSEADLYVAFFSNNRLVDEINGLIFLRNTINRNEETIVTCLLLGAFDKYNNIDISTDHPKDITLLEKNVEDGYAKFRINDINKDITVEFCLRTDTKEKRIEKRIKKTFYLE